jgi:hypothetical protein
MISEERRLNASMIGGVQFLMFPVMILFMSLVLSLASKQLMSNMPLDQVYLVLHIVIIGYGVSVGGIGLFGDRIAERRFGSVSMILQTPATQPITYRQIFADFYVKEIIYYFGYSILPLVGGIALSIPLTGFQASSVLFLLLTASLSFVLGMSFSFFVSSLYTRSKRLIGLLIGTVLGIVLLVFVTQIARLSDLVPSIALQRTHEPIFLALSLAVIVIFSAVAVTTIRVRAGKHSGRYEAKLFDMVTRFSFVRSYSTLMGKDWVDLRRSGTLGPVMGAYVGPLAILALVFWFLGSFLSIKLELNMVFYAAMIGFFSVSIYSWLNLLDNNAFMEVLPVTVAQVIRTKLLLLSLLAAALSTIFLAILSVSMGQISTLLIGLLVAYATTAYTVTSTAYLTGLRTNSYLFDPRVLGKFSGLSIPPLIALVLLSLSYSLDAVLVPVIILLVCSILAVITFIMYRKIEGRWGRETFVF